MPSIIIPNDGSWEMGLIWPLKEVPDPVFGEALPDWGNELDALSATSSGKSFLMKKLYPIRILITINRMIIRMMRIFFGVICFLS